MAILTHISKLLMIDSIGETGFKQNNQENHDKDILYFMKQRRTFKQLGKKVAFRRTYLNNLIKESIRCCPSALNSQSARIVIIMDEAHFKFWHMVKELYKETLIVQGVESNATEIDRCSDAFGTVLFFEDQDVIRALQKQKPLQAADFVLWSEQTSGMAQFAVWTALSSIGLGAALQHFNPAIDQKTAQMFGLAESWKLKAQLIFGSIQQPAEQKTVEDDESMFKVFHSI